MKSMINAKLIPSYLQHKICVAKYNSEAWQGSEMLREAYSKVKDRKDKDAKQGSGTCDAHQSTKDTAQ